MNRPVAATARTQPERVEQRRTPRTRGRQTAIETRRRKKNIQRAAIAGVVALLLVIGGYYAYAAITHEEPGEAFATSGENNHIEQGQTVDDYTTDPPTSGRHWSNVARWGVYTEPVPNEQQVHSLEHGGIVIQYDAERIQQDALQDLTDKVNEIPVKVILAPRDGMAAPITLTAWGRMLELQEYDEAQVDAFIDAYIDEGPETIQEETQLLDRWRERND